MKVVTVGLGHKLYDRTRAIGTTYSLCHNRLGGCYIKEVPDVELHIFSGGQGIDSLINSPYLEKFLYLPDKKQKVLQLFEHKNVYEHGRIGHKELVE